jgi:hypothetical protein
MQLNDLATTIYSILTCIIALQRATLTTPTLVTPVSPTV